MQTRTGATVKHSVLFSNTQFAKTEKYTWIIVRPTGKNNNNNNSDLVLWLYKYENRAQIRDVSQNSLRFTGWQRRRLPLWGFAALL